MKTNKIGTLFLVSTLALAGIGISYAGFADVINIHGTVQTADVEFTITDYSGTWVYKVYGAIGAPTNEIYIDHEGKGLDWVQLQYPGCTVQLVSYAEARAPTIGDPAGYDVIVDFHKLIPNIDYEANIVFTIGTIPVKFNQITIAPIAGSEWMGPLIASHNIYAKLYVTRDGVNVPVVLGTQVHPGEVVVGEVHITIPQDNAYQGKTGTGSATFGIEQWNDECNPNHQTPGKVLNLPTDPITIVYTYPGLAGLPSYWDMTLSGIVGSGYNVANGQTYDGWCVDEETYIVPGQPYTINLVSSYDAANPWVGNYNYAWPCVNYIINHKAAGASWEQIQYSIWYFINDGYFGYDPVVLGMIGDAVLNGQNFVPGAGQFVAVLCVASPQYQHGYFTQHTIIEVDP